MTDLIIAEREDIVAIADAVRNKTGSTSEMTLGGIVSEINGIEAGGGASVETCTIDCGDPDTLNWISYISYEDGEVVCHYNECPSSWPITVIKNSIFLVSSDGLEAACGCDGDVEMWENYFGMTNITTFLAAGNGSVTPW